MIVKEQFVEEIDEIKEDIMERFTNYYFFIHNLNKMDDSMFDDGFKALKVVSVYVLAKMLYNILSKNDYDKIEKILIHYVIILTKK